MDIAIRNCMITGIVVGIIMITVFICMGLGIVLPKGLPAILMLSGLTLIILK